MDIKFRIWSKKENAFLNTDIMFTNAGQVEIYWMGGCYDYLDDNYIVQQYTGLKDKNGIEIYEGDILQTKNSNQSPYDRHDPSLRFVKRHEYDNQLHLFGSIDAEYPASGFGLNNGTRKRFRVIGNIFEGVNIR